MPLPADFLRALASKLPQVEEGTSCAKAAFKAGKKSFLFVGEADGTCEVMVKLAGSLKEAEHLAAKEPECYKVGVHGWVTCTFAPGRKLPKGLFERWVEESFRLVAPKRLVALLAT